MLIERNIYLLICVFLRLYCFFILVILIQLSVFDVHLLPFLHQTLFMIHQLSGFSLANSEVFEMIVSHCIWDLRMVIKIWFHWFASFRFLIRHIHHLLSLILFESYFNLLASFWFCFLNWFASTCRLASCRWRFTSRCWWFASFLSLASNFSESIDILVFLRALFNKLS